MYSLLPLRGSPPSTGIRMGCSTQHFMATVLSSLSSFLSPNCCLIAVAACLPLCPQSLSLSPTPTPLLSVPSMCFSPVQHTDEELWSALHRSHLMATIQALGQRGTAWGVVWHGCAQGLNVCSHFQMSQVDWMLNWVRVERTYRLVSSNCSASHGLLSAMLE